MEEKHKQEESGRDWMDRLAIESWQAEMVISGVAIFGSLQLFTGVNWLIDWFYFSMPEAFLGLAYFLAFYLLITVAVLCMSFLMHFIIRAIWIASIGLESVYPHGIRKESDLYAAHFMERLHARFPDFHQFNQELDRLGSSVLAYALSFVMVFTGIGVLLSVAMAIGLFLTNFMNDELAMGIILAVLGLMIIAMLSVSILNNEKWREHKWVQKIHFPLAMYVAGYMFLNVFFKPHTYIMYTIRTNLDPKRYWGLVAGLLVGVLLLSFSLIGQTQIIALMEDLYLRYDKRSDRMYAQNYEDQSADYAMAYIRPQIPSSVIHHPADLELFLPMPERESRKLFALCSFEEPADTVDREAYRLAYRSYRLDCFKEQLEIKMDDQLLPYIMKVYVHPHQNEEGLLFFFPGLALTTGEHQIQIIHRALEENGGKIDNIPFIYLPKE